jgi:hypothetical protein
VDRRILLGRDDGGPSPLAKSAAKKLSNPGGHKSDDSKSQKEPGHAAKTFSVSGRIVELHHVSHLVGMLTH